ncbi:MAG: aldehyde dehydrogenase family protein [Nocardiopsaceae bacterium]|nr:aldehyde dehydrogenase family protein [Nocardiopsaceae bacterium]
MTAPATTYINGSWTDRAGRLDVTSPADGSVVGSISYGGAAAAADAADAAAAAFPAWSATPGRARGDLLHALASDLAGRAGEIGPLLARESGKRLPEGVAEVRFAAEFFRWFGEQARRPASALLAPETPGRRHLVSRRPAGVAVCLTPWNFPVSIQARKLAAALAAGCTTVSRASEKAPLAVVEMFRCLDRAGFPAGVANLVHGPAGEISQALLAHESVRVVSFTGSTAVGRQIMTLAARRIVRPALELGGDAPFLVFDDADVDAAVAGALIAKFRNNGQSCIAANRFLVQDGVYDQFAGKLVAAVDSMSVGDPLADPPPGLGPLIDEARVNAVRDLVDEAVAAGAQRLTRDFALPGKGCYAPPVLMGEVPGNVGIATTEVFGPAAGLFRFATEDEAIARANQTEMGLAAYAYTRDLGRAARLGDQLEAGILGVNDPVPSAVFAPLGGVKQSGLGREGGSEGLEEFQNVHYLAQSS